MKTSPENRRTAETKKKKKEKRSLEHKGHERGENGVSPGRRREGEWNYAVVALREGEKLRNKGGEGVAVEN